jgi:chromosomal replication initiation ATPase DnaA
MPNSDLMAPLLSKIHENQLALEAAIMELSSWVEQQGSSDTAENVREALAAIDRNEDFIKMTLALIDTSI